MYVYIYIYMYIYIYIYISVYIYIYRYVQHICSLAPMKTLYLFMYLMLGLFSRSSSR